MVSPIKLKDSLILWNPITIENPDGMPRIIVIQRGHNHPCVKAYRYSSGGCYMWVHSAPFMERKAFVLAEALCIIIRDGLDPQEVHSAMLSIEEYLTCFPIDAKANPDHGNAWYL